MDPITWAVIAGLNVAMASQKASQQARQRKMEADIRAAEIEASPWTGRAPSTQVSTAAPNVWAEMAGAGINTLGQGAALQQAGLFTGAEKAAEATATSPTLMQTDPYAMMARNKSFAKPWEVKQLASTKMPWE